MIIDEVPVVGVEVEGAARDLFGERRADSDLHTSAWERDLIAGGHLP